MGAPPDIRFGILKCRDLVQLYYGVRMVTVVQQGNIAISDFNPHLILNQDPRRISYELMLTGNNIGANTLYFGDSQDQAAAQTGEVVVTPTVGSQVLRRDFLTQGDSVCQAVWMKTITAALSVGFRAIILTPIPIDEIP